MSVAKIMSTKLISVTPDTTVGDMYNLINRNTIQHLLVMENNHLLGIITDKCILKNLSPFINTQVEDKKDRYTLNRKARQIMSVDAVKLPVSVSVRDVARAMIDHNFSLITIVSDDDTREVLGVISWKDVLRFLV